MSLLSEIVKRLWFAPCLLGIVASVSLFHHGLTGSRGVIAMRATQQEISQLKDVQEGIASKRRQWEARTQALYAQHMDADLLDETARHVLGVTADNEYIIFF